MPMRILKKVEMGPRLKQLFLEKPIKSYIPRPGDFISIGDLYLPIIDISDAHGVLKITTIYDDSLPRTNFVEVEKVRPRKGKIYLIGALYGPTIATLRMRGYEVYQDPIEEPDFLILTEPKIHSLESYQNIVIAPAESLSITHYNQLNTLLREVNTGISYNLNKPLIRESELVLNASYYNRQIYLRKPVNAYYLKVDDGVILCSINDKGPIIAYSSRKVNVWAFSTARILYPFDLIYGKGENSLLLMDIIKSKQITIRGEEKQKKKKGISIGDKSEILIELGGVKPALAFQKTLAFITRLGAIIEKRDDVYKQAELKLTPPLGAMSIKISLKRDKLSVTCSSCKSDEDLRNLRSITSLIKTYITDLAHQQLNREKLRLLIRSLANFYKRLLTAKDMLELDINAGEIQNELCEAYSSISSLEFLQEVAREIISYCRDERKEINPLKPYPEEIKLELLAKIDEWYEKVTLLSEKNI